MPNNYITEEQMLDQEEARIVAAQQAGQSSQIPYASAMFAGQQKQNLIEWELDFSEELDKIQKLFRSDILIIKDGKEEWASNPDTGKVLLNEVGVQDMIRFIYTLVNKNKVLSNYKIDEIQERVRQIKHELRMQIYNNAEVYGIDNEYKRNNYPMIVIITGSLIEDAYRRAMGGEAHRGLGEARIVQQNDSGSLMPNQQFFMGQPQKKGFLSKLNPFSWGK